MEQKEVTIGEWKFSTHDGFVYASNEKRGQSFAVPVEAINDLIVGLLVINPGPNPALVNKATMARRFETSPETVARWFARRIVPGAMQVESDGSGPYVAPEAGLALFERPQQGNPDFGKK